MDINYENLLNEVLGEAVLKLAGSVITPEENEQITKIIRIFNKHGITTMEALQIVIEMADALNVSEENEEL